MIKKKWRKIFPFKTLRYNLNQPKTKQTFTVSKIYSKAHHLSQKNLSKAVLISTHSEKFETKYFSILFNFHPKNFRMSATVATLNENIVYDNNDNDTDGKVLFYKENNK
jgi:hypothetical protein